MRVICVTCWCDRPHVKHLMMWFNDDSSLQYLSVIYTHTKEAWSSRCYCGSSDNTLTLAIVFRRPPLPIFTPGVSCLSATFSGNFTSPSNEINLKKHSTITVKANTSQWPPEKPRVATKQCHRPHNRYAFDRPIRFWNLVWYFPACSNVCYGRCRCVFIVYVLRFRLVDVQCACVRATALYESTTYSHERDDGLTSNPVTKCDDALDFESAYVHLNCRLTSVRLCHGWWPCLLF